MTQTPGRESFSPKDLPSRGADRPSAESSLTHADLQEFRTELLHLRDWLLASLAHIEHRAAQHASHRESVAPAGSAPESLLAELAWHENQTHRELSDRWLLLREVHQALDRIESETFGLCISDQRAIPRSLLEEVPWAKYCTGCATRQAS